MIDEYAKSGEFLDLLITPFWQSLAPVLTEALAGVDVATGPVVDVGAGSGRSTEVIATAVPGATVLAIEPSPMLRAVLLSRMSAHEHLRDAVTVIPDRFRPEILPRRISALVAMNVIGHFTPAERRTIWRSLQTTLAPTGRAVVNLQPPSRAVAVPETPTTTVHQGTRRYEGTGHAEPTGGDQVVWHMTYRTYDGSRLASEISTNYAWWVLDEPQLAEEVAEFGLTLRPTGPAELGVYVITGSRSTSTPDQEDR